MTSKVLRVGGFYPCSVDSLVKGMRSDLTKAENASDNARKHAAHNSAVILADPTHYDANGNHIDNGH